MSTRTHTSRDHLNLSQSVSVCLSSQVNNLQPSRNDTGAQFEGQSRLKAASISNNKATIAYGPETGCVARICNRQMAPPGDYR